MHSSDSFRLMENFIDEVDDKKIAGSLRNALRRRKPFQNFRNVLDYHNDVLQKWYKYKSEKMIVWVKDQLFELELKDDEETDNL